MQPIAGPEKKPWNLIQLRLAEASARAKQSIEQPLTSFDLLS